MCYLTDILRFSGLIMFLVHSINGECKDKSASCQQWEIDYGCDKGDWKDFMEGYCPKTCDVCVPSTEEEIDEIEEEVVNTVDENKKQRSYEDIMNSKFENPANDSPDKVYTEDGRTDDEYIMFYYPNKDFKCADYSNDCEQWTRTYKCDSSTWGRNIRMSCPQSCNLSYCKGKFSSPTHKTEVTKKKKSKTPKTMTEDDVDEREVQTKKKNSACKDNNRKCTQYMKYCTSTIPKYRDYMKDNCAKSCNFCESSEIVKPTKVDSVTNPLTCSCDCSCIPSSNSPNNGCSCSCSCTPK